MCDIVKLLFPLDSKTEDKKEEVTMETETKQEETVVKETTDQPMESADSTQETAETGEWVAIEHTPRTKTQNFFNQSLFCDILLL